MGAASAIRRALCWKPPSLLPPDCLRREILHWGSAQRHCGVCGHVKHPEAPPHLRPLAHLHDPEKNDAEGKITLTICTRITSVCMTQMTTFALLHTPSVRLLPMNSSSKPSTFFLRPRLLLMTGRSASSEPLALCPVAGPC